MNRKLTTLISGLVACWTSSPAYAEIELDGSLGPVDVQSGDMVILEQMGTRVGNNLFHSFAILNVGADESLTFVSDFSGPTQNVLSRVTGGSQSLIDGLLQSDIQGADLWIFNPAGVVFGADARVDVPASVHISSADFVSLGDGTDFSLNTPGSSLTIANPVAFGFLPESSPAAITLAGTNEVGGQFTAVAGSIDVDGAEISADSLYLTTATADSVITIIDTDATPDNFSGSIDLVDSNITINGGRVMLHGGDIQLQSSSIISDVDDTADGGRFVLHGDNILLEQSQLRSNTTGTADASRIELIGTESVRHAVGSIVQTTGQTGSSGDLGGIEIDTAVLEQSNSFMLVLTLGNGLGGAFDINASESIFMESGFGNAFANNTFSSQRAGDVNVTTPVLTMRGGSILARALQANGQGGDINLNVGFLDIQGGSQISARGDGGNSGDISITADDILVTGRHPQGYFSAISSPSGFPNAGNAGNIDIQTGSLTVDDGAFISAFTGFIGNAGRITINATEEVYVGGIANQTNTQIFGGIFANTSGTGAAGGIAINSPRLTIAPGGFLQSSTFLNFPPFIGGQAGTIDLDLGTLIIDGSNNDFATVGTGISAISFGNGPGGTIRIQADDITMSGSNGTFDGIFAETVNAGNAGTIEIQAANLTINEGAYISATTFGAGNAGGTEIDLTGTLRISSNSNPVTGLLNTALFGASGNAGNLMVNADVIEVDGLGGIEVGVGANSSGNGGAITLNTRRLDLTNGGRVIASSSGSGDAGNLSITATESISASGTAPGDLGNIGSVTNASGNGGSIDIVTPQLALADGGSISASTFGTGAGGSITIAAGNTVIAGIDANTDQPAQIATRSAGPGSGAAGVLNFAGNNLTLGDNGLITATTESDLTDNQPATININLTDGVNIDGSFSGIFASTNGLANAGNINVDASNFLFENGGSIQSSSSGGGRAGNILLSGDQLTLRNSARILTNAQTSSGGNVDLVFVDQVLLQDSRISAAANGVTPDSDGGNVSIDPVFVILQNSDILASANAGNGGNISVVAQQIFIDPQSTLDATSQTGVDGLVRVDSLLNVSDSVVPVEQPATQATDVLVSSCEQRVRQGQSTLTQTLANAPPSAASERSASGYLRTREQSQAESAGGC